MRNHSHKVQLQLPIRIGSVAFGTAVRQSVLRLVCAINDQREVRVRPYLLNLPESVAQPLSLDEADVRTLIFDDGS